MKEIVTISVKENYGTISVHLEEYIQENKISRSKFAEKAGIDPRVVKKMCEGKSTRIDFDTLCRICYVLERDVKDIISYIPPKISD